MHDERLCRDTTEDENDPILGRVCRECDRNLPLFRFKNRARACRECVNTRVPVKASNGVKGFMCVVCKEALPACYYPPQYHTRKGIRNTCVFCSALRDSEKRAKDKGVPWEKIAKNELGDLSKCAETGVDFTFNHIPREPLAPSLDRFDAKMGYVRGNLRFVLAAFNNAKNTASNEAIRGIIIQMAEGLTRPQTTPK